MIAPTQNCDMTRGAIAPLVLRFAWPLLIGNLFQQMYNMVDTIVIGNFESTAAQAAVSVGHFPYQIFIALFLGLGTGTTILISQYCGADQPQGLCRVAQTANALIFYSALPLSLLGIALSRPLLRWMNTPPESFAQAYAYLAILFAGVVTALGYNLNAGILRGMGDSKSPLLFLIVSTLVNIVLDLVFVAVLHWGTVGVAVATVIAQGVAWIYSIYFLRKHYPALWISPFRARIHAATLRDILRLGLPIGLNNALFSLGHMILSALINTYGAVFAAGYSIAGKLDAISFLPITSFTAAATTFVGQNIGARQYDRLRRGIHTALCMTLCINVATAALMLLCGKYLLGFFNPDPAVVEIGYAYIVRLEPFYWIYSLMFLLNGVMNGAGEVRVPALANIVLFWVARLPAAFLLARFAGPLHLFFCYGISWFCGALITVSYYLTGRWKRRFDTPLSRS